MIDHPVATHSYLFSPSLKPWQVEPLLTMGENPPRDYPKGTPAWESWVKAQAQFHALLKADPHHYDGCL